MASRVLCGSTFGMAITGFICLDGDQPARANFIHWGFCIEERQENQFLLCLVLADATSKHKTERDYAKASISRWEEKGRAFYEAATLAIANLKAQA